jgi:hypothetical protein
VAPLPRYDRLLIGSRSYKQRLTSCLVTVCGMDLYVLQDADTVAQMRKSPSVVQAVQFYTYIMKSFFALPAAGVDAYLRDHTGLESKPYGSDPHFSGHHLSSTMRRYAQLIHAKLDELPTSQDGWTTCDDLSVFFQKCATPALLEALFDVAFLQLNPRFTTDIWELNRDIPWLARCLPRFVIPTAYRRRVRLAAQVRRWHNHARVHFTEASIAPDGDADPYWGSELVRNRHRTLSQVDGFNEECMVAVDLGFIWGYVCC